MSDYPYFKPPRHAPPGAVVAVAPADLDRVLRRLANIDTAADRRNGGRAHHAPLPADRIVRRGRRDA